MKTRKEPSWIRRMWIRIVNKVLRRKCGSCRHWVGHGVFCEGSCGRGPFFSLPTEYSWNDACCHYEKRH